MNRIDKKFKELKKKKRNAFIAYLTAGDPSLSVTKDLVLALEKAGVDIVELGIPFSDPMADGPTIQAASQRALSHHVTLDKIFGLVKEIRKYSQIPLAFMSYYNPVFHFNEKRFVQKAKAVGIDGLIIPDLPPEEGRDLLKLARAEKMSLIFFLAPTTTLARMKYIVQKSTGFIYYVSLTGVTGARKELPSDLIRNVKIAKRLTDKPVCVGFGVSQGAQIQMISKIADGVIVGSAIIKEIEKNKGKRDLVNNVSRFVTQLTAHLK